MGEPLYYRAEKRIIQKVFLDHERSGFPRHDNRRHEKSLGDAHVVSHENDRSLDGVYVVKPGEMALPAGALDALENLKRDVDPRGIVELARRRHPSGAPDNAHYVAMEIPSCA